MPKTPPKNKSNGTAKKSGVHAPSSSNTSNHGGDVQNTPTSPHVSGKPHAPTKAEWAHRAQIWEGFFSIARQLIRSAAWVSCFVILWQCIRTIAGTDTKFSAVVNAVVDLKLNEWFAYAVAGGTSIAYVREKKLRQNTIKQNEEYIRQLEQKIDPKRSTSGLTVIGEPRKEELNVL